MGTPQYSAPQAAKPIVSLYPYNCKFRDSDEFFIPTMINYEERTVWKTAQKSDDGIWVSFDELVFHRNDDFQDPAFPTTAQESVDLPSNQTQSEA